MPFRIKQLFLYFLLFDFFREMYMGLNRVGPVQFMKEIFESFKSFSLEVTSTLSFFLYALAAYFFLWYFSKHRKQFWGFVLILCCIPLVILFRYLLEEIISPAVFGFRNYQPGIKLQDYMQDNKYFSIPNTAFGIIFYFLQSNRHKDNEKNNLQIQNRQAELDYLKSQINPHFLFNNLNGIYSLIYHKSDKALQAVEQLSSLLRYMLYEKNQKVLLTQETAYLLNFIDLQKLRFNYELPLQLQNNIENTDLQIAPLLLIPLVENAFKHGDFRHPQFPLMIQLKTTGRLLHFTVENKKGNYEKDAVSGIGINNLKRRLALIYPGNYQIEITESETCYKTSLSINL